MDLTSTLNELENLAQQVGLEVVYDKFSGQTHSVGGLCRVKGQWRAIIEKRASKGEKVSLLARFLGKFNTQELNQSESVRSLLERYVPTPS